MSFYPLNLPLTNSSGALLTGGLAETDMNLRVSPYTSRAYTQLAQANGVYTFGSIGDPIIPGEYKLYRTDTEITAFGILKIGENNAVTLTGNQTIADVKTFSSAPVLAHANGVLTNTISERTANSGVTIDGVLIKDSLAGSNIASASDLDALELLCADFANRGAGSNQSIARQWTFITTPYVTSTVTSPFHATTAKYVQDYVNNYLTGSISAGQQSANEIIIDYNGTVEANKRYTNIDAGLTAANAFADSSTRMVIFIEGNGGGTMDTDYNLLTVSYDDYVDVVGIEQSCIVRIDDDNYVATTLGQKIISNCTIETVNSATPTFSKFIFKNVKFTTLSGTATIALTDCILLDCTSEGGVTMSLTTCLGNITDLTNSKQRVLQDSYDKTNVYQTVYANGDIRGKRVLGRQGSDIASASSITLGEGNFFVITGTTDIADIDLTDWTDGSSVRLKFSGVLDVKNGTGNIVRDSGDLATSSDMIVEFVKDGAFWYVTNPL